MVTVACYRGTGKVQVCGCGCVKPCRLVTGVEAISWGPAFCVYSRAVGANWGHMHGNKASCGEMGWRGS